MKSFMKLPKYNGGGKIKGDEMGVNCGTYRGADKSLARPVRKQATAIEDFDFHISYL